jgi:hypothetical protein
MKEAPGSNSTDVFRMINPFLRLRRNADGRLTKEQLAEIFR